MNATYNAALALLRQDIGYGDSQSVKDKIDRVVDIAIDSVNSAYDWRKPFDKGNPSDADTKVRALLAYALARELAIPVTGRTEDLKTIDAMYQQKLNEAKIADFEESVKEETDGFVTSVFSLCVGSLASSEKQVAMHSYGNMKKRIDAGKGLAEKMIRASHEWSDGYEIGDGLLAVATAMSVASAFGANENQVTLLTQRYQQELADAVAKDMDDEICALRSSPDEGDRFASRVIDILRSYWSDADVKYGNGQPKPCARGIAAMVRHIGSVKKTVRDEVLFLYDWGFAKRETACRSMACGVIGDELRYRTQMPGDASRIVKCFNVLGDKVECMVREGLWLVSKEPVARIVYICDVEDEREWPPLAMRAYERKVAAAVAAGDSALASNPQRVAQIAQMAEKAVQDARTADARQTHMASGAYGRNHLADVATGKR